MFTIDPSSKYQSQILPRFIYNPTTPATPSSFATISALARLGHKYEMDHLVKQALDYLKAHFTTDVDTWRRHADVVPPGFTHLHAIGVVNIARLTDCTSVLPSAYAVCCTLSADALSRGFTREDGTQETFVHQADFLNVMDGKTRLMRAATKACQSAFEPSQVEGHRGNDWERCRNTVRRLMYSLDPALISNDDPFCATARYIGQPSEEMDMCGSCREELRRRIARERRAIWVQLPTIMNVGVEGWPTS